MLSRAGEILLGLLLLIVGVLYLLIAYALDRGYWLLCKLSRKQYSPERFTPVV